MTIKCLNEKEISKVPSKTESEKYNKHFLTHTGNRHLVIDTVTWLLVVIYVCVGETVHKNYQLFMD